MSRRRLCSFLRSTSLLATLTMPGFAIDLKLTESVPAPGNNTVTLRNMSAETFDAEQLADPRKYLSYTEAGAYSVALKSIEHSGADRFFVYEFIVWKRDAQPKTHVLINVSSTGSFVDFVKETPFSVQDGRERAEGNISLPFHPLDPLALCEGANLPTKNAPARVFLTGSTLLPVALNCEKAVAPPVILRLTESPRANPGYWKDIAIPPRFRPGEGRSRPATEKSFDLLVATATPNVLAAAAARLHSLKTGNSPDDEVAFDVTYAIPPGGLEKALKINVPVTFYPSPFVAAGALTIGVALGWVATALLLISAGRGKSWPFMGKGLGLGFVLAIIAYILALVFYGAGCGLKIVGIELNPADVLQLVLLGLTCGFFGLVKAEWLLTMIDAKLTKASTARAAIPLLAFAFLLLPPCAMAGAEPRAPLQSIAGCPDGPVVAIDKEGIVIEFSTAAAGTWRKAGRIYREFNPVEIACANVNGAPTAFIVTMSIGRTWLIRMDVGTGSWRAALLGVGASGGVAVDPDGGHVFVSAVDGRVIYRTDTDLGRLTQWASVFDSHVTITSLVVDARKRLLVGEAFEGLVYAFPLDTARQSTYIRGFGLVTAFAVNRERNVLFVADRGRRTIWTVALGDVPVPRVLYRGAELRNVSGLALDGQANIWVSNAFDSKILVLGPDGKQRAVIP